MSAAARRRRARVAAITAAVTAIALLAAARWVLVPYRIVGDSMLPTLRGRAEGMEAAGDIVLVHRLAYAFSAPERWDVVVIGRRSGGADGGHESVKRVAGLPGETVEIRGGRVVVDGRPVDLPAAIAGSTVVAKGPHGHSPVRLGPAEIFVLGDNSYLSSDSRSWGPVSIDDLEGRVVLVAWPIARFGAVR